LFTLLSANSFFVLITGQTLQMAMHFKGPCLQAVLRPQQPRSQRALHPERPVSGAFQLILCSLRCMCRLTAPAKVSIGGADLSVIQVSGVA
jgi:hypothetical protein